MDSDELQTTAIPVDVRIGELDVLLAPLLRSGGDAPHSDNGRAATAVAQRHGCGLRNRTRTVIEEFRIEEGVLAAQSIRLRFPHGPLAQPRRRPCQRPSLLGCGGEQNVNLQIPACATVQKMPQPMA